MGRSGMMRMTVMMLGVLLMVPSLVWAADGDAAAAPAELTDATRAEILETIEATRQTDPELAAVMEEQLRQVESGELPLHELTGSETERGLALGAPDVAGRGGLTADAPGIIGPPVPPTGDWTIEEDYLPPEVRSQLEKLFQEKGTGDPAKDAAVREEAERILREHGFEPPEWMREGDWHEGEWKDRWGDWDNVGGIRPEEGGFERGWEHMSPEAREQMERLYQERGTEAPEVFREIFEHEYGSEPTHEHETFERAFEAPTYEAPTHEYEAPTHEYEAPTSGYEAPTREYEHQEYQPPQQ